MAAETNDRQASMVSLDGAGATSAARLTTGPATTARGLDSDNVGVPEHPKCPSLEADKAGALLRLRGAGTHFGAVVEFESSPRRIRELYGGSIDHPLTAARQY